MTDRRATFTVQEVVRYFDCLCLKDDAEQKEYAVLRAVGSGVSGTAFLVHRTSEKRNYIAKVTDLSMLSDKKKAYARSEVKCLAQCNHFAIIKHVDSFETPDGSKLLLLMELADAGDLGRQIKHRSRSMGTGDETKPPYFKEHEVAFLFLQVVLAVHYMHNKGILHRDIKSANVFLMSVGIVKLGDLGFSQVYEDTVSNEVGRTFCGTPYYLAPELWRRHRYSKKADVWSLGVLLYEMACLKRPFTGDTMLKLYDRIMGGQYEPLPDFYSQDLCDVVAAILVFDPDARPATGEILRMKYMQFVMSQFERTITSATSFTDEQKRFILDAVIEAREELKREPPAPRHTGPRREVQKKGVVLKLSFNGGWKQRYLLFDGFVLTISAVESTVGDTRNLNIDQIQGAFPVAVSEVGRNCCFSVVLNSDNGAKIYFQTSTEAEAKEWVDALNEGLEAYARKKADSAKKPLERELHDDSPNDNGAAQVFPTNNAPILQPAPECPPIGGSDANPSPSTQ
jgi:serine/threonine protein kinase